MPEGHIIRIEADRQQRVLSGKRVRASSPQGRFTEADVLDGKTLRQVEGRGKLLFYHFPKDTILAVHLGRLGRFRLHETADPPEPRGAVRLRLQARHATLDLIAPITCKLVTPEHRTRELARLGPDPLAPDFDEPAARAWVRDKVARSRKPIGALLLDQSIFTGVGNIFRAEALFRVGVHPAVLAQELTDGQFDALWRDMLHLMRVATDAGHIVGVERSDVDKPATKLKRGERFLVYHRDTCRRCGSELETLTLGGREIQYCPEHQPVPGRS